MKLVRLICFLLLSCVLFSGTTGLAADRATTFNWTGPYVGVHLGYGWGNADTDFSPRPNSFTDLAPTTLSPDPSGVFGGLQAGYNYQMGCWVFGLETDFSGSGISGTDTVSPIPRQAGSTFLGAGTLTAHEDINWFGTLRPRIGYTVMPTLLLYGTGGLAYGNVSYSANTNFRPPQTNESYPVSFSTTKVGWTAGGGLEYAVCRNWTVKAEYLFIDLGSETAVGHAIPPLPGFRVKYDFETTAHTFNIGVNYKF